MCFGYVKSQYKLWALCDGIQISDKTQISVVSVVAEMVIRTCTGKASSTGVDGMSV